MAIDALNVLNEKQLEAVNIIDGPLVVYAGAGTGKTRTLTYRVANMVDKGIDPTTILAITFTKKATNEMRERLFTLVGPKASLITISTIHALCAKILRHDIVYLDYKRSFGIVDEEDQLKVIADCLEEMGIDRKAYTAKYAKKVIIRFKCLGIKPKQYVEQSIINKYESTMKELNLLDFEDLLLKTEELFSLYPDVLKKYQALFNYILVDEFQDTDTVQYHIISMLARNHHNLFLVGDDDQSIYSFRGTNYENIKRFKTDFPEYKSVILTKNYRSTQKILDGCNRLIDNNTDREKKSLESDMPGLSDDVTVYQAIDDRDEVDYVVNHIKAQLRSDIEANEIAVLYRNSNISRQFELAFMQAGIPFKVYGGVGFLRRREVKDMLAYFKLLLNDDDAYSFKRVINVPARSIGLKTIEKIFVYRKENKVTIIDAVDALKDELKNKYKVINEFFLKLDNIRKMLENTRLDKIFDQIFNDFEFSKSYEDEENEEEREQNVLELKSVFVNLEDDGQVIDRKDKLINAFDEAILSDDKLPNQKERKDGVILSTVHSVKGLEFKIVYVVAFEDGIFPNTNRTDSEVDLEEERRVAYVACTRAKQKLFLTCANKRMLYGYKVRNNPSLFLNEFVGGLKQKTILDFAKPPVKEKEKIEMKNDTDYKVGEKIKHKVYGEGIVVSLNGTIGTICFPHQGIIKQFDMTHPSIQKL